MAGNFTEIDEEFTCENCGKHVPKLGYAETIAHTACIQNM